MHETQLQDGESGSRSTVEPRSMEWRISVCLEKWIRKLEGAIKTENVWGCYDGGSAD